jgi:hypothetical protein
MDHIEDLGVLGKTILKGILKKHDTWVWNGLIWIKIGASGGLLRTSNQLSRCIKCREFLHQLRNY